MTNTETAIALLSEFKEKHTFYGKDHERDMNDTFNLAIKALEEKEERSRYPSELHRIVARKEEADRAADALDKHIAEWEAKYGSKI